jgi:hypothetical protein
MTRLTSHQNKSFLSQLLITVAIIIAVLVFLVTFGFKLLISGSLFINQLANGSVSKQNSSSSTSSLTSLTIDPVEDATNSSRLIVSGETVNFDTVSIYLNGDKVTDAKADDGTFQEEVSGLEKGDNTIYFIAHSKNSTETKRSAQFTVAYKTDKPKLDISTPQDGSKTNKQNITIQGKTDKEIYVRVNDQPVVVNADGSFTTSYKLNDGDNTLTFIAQDIVGNQETKIVKVNYSKDD